MYEVDEMVLLASCVIGMRLSQKMIITEVDVLNTWWAIWEEQAWIWFPLLLPLRPRVDLNIVWFLFVRQPHLRVIPSSYVLIG